MKKLKLTLLTVIVSMVLPYCTFCTSPDSGPLTLKDCIAIALKQNPSVLKAKEEIRKTKGIIVEARAAAIPNLTASGDIRQIDENSIDIFPGSMTGPRENQKQPWSVDVEITQSVYSGGRVGAAIRAAKISDQIAALSFQKTIADTVLEVRKAFYQVLLNKALIVVREQSVKLLEQQLNDTRHRYDVGAVPRFNVLRAEVELANAQPPLIRAQNNFRLSRETLVKLLAIDTNGSRSDFTPIELADSLTFEMRIWTMSEALMQAISDRPELKQAKQQVLLAKENIVNSKAGYKPDIKVFGNYGVRNTIFGDDLDDTLNGWTIGARATWPLFDGMLTQGKVTQAKAQLSQKEIDAAEIKRTIDLEVRQAYSDYLQALALIEAQKKTVEQAEESLRLAETRFKAGTGTQLDVLSAQTALTEVRSNEILALHDYNVAVATLDRVTGAAIRIAN